MSNKQFDYDPQAAYKDIVGDTNLPSMRHQSKSTKSPDQESLAQKNVRFYPSQLKQIALMAIELGKDQSALLRDVWDEYYRAHIKD